MDKKLASSREKLIKDTENQTAKEREAIKKAEEKHERELKKQEDKYKREVARLEARKETLSATRRILPLTSRLAMTALLP